MATQKHKKNKGTTKGKVKVAADTSSDGDLPYCKRRKSGDKETKMRENEDSIIEERKILPKVRNNA